MKMKAADRHAHTPRDASRARRQAHQWRGDEKMAVFPHAMSPHRLHPDTAQLIRCISAWTPTGSSLGLFDWKYDHILSGSGGFESANSEAHFTGPGMMGIANGSGGGGAEYHALNALRYAAGLGEHLALPFGGATSRAERDSVVAEMKPQAERLLSLEWCGEASRAPTETSISSLGGLGLWSGMITGATHHHHGSSAAI
ncbi:hypothetical protein TRIUR3_20976 [Triticum urartu]|uniref:Uncharacterized protein n=2 Tax=Triticum TaxID=4564 RepID=A0A9R1B1Y9_TRITD|nr:hypothetical protein TRIUR3_20976 [Triticum urartu]VAI48521.1 unnamed protein product [Triticum turgidum subsp. durum]